MVLVGKTQRYGVGRDPGIGYSVMGLGGVQHHGVSRDTTSRGWKGYRLWGGRDPCIGHRVMGMVGVQHHGVRRDKTSWGQKG